MSKGSVILGDATGKLGDIVLYRTGGAQIARLRVRHPRNPRSTRQMVSRVFQATAIRAYSWLKELCSGTFEGKNGRGENYHAFVAENVNQWNKTLNDYAQGWQDMTAFCKRYDAKAQINAYLVSNGTLPTLGVIMRSGGVGFGTWANKPASMTYQEACDSISISKGDVLLIIGIQANEVSGEILKTEFARIVMQPADGDMSKPFIDSTTHKINDPHPMTTDNFTITITSQGGFIVFTWQAYWGTIVREHDDGIMKRYSAQKIIFRHTPTAPTTLSEAVKSWWQTPAKGKYLNKAERQLHID